MRTPGLWLSAVLLLVVTACGTSSSTSVTAPTGTRCGVSVQAASSTIAAGGGTGSITVDTARECQWSAAADAPWLSIMSGKTGQGSGSVTFSAASNTSVSTRLGRININDQRIDITQEAAVCEYTVVPAAISAGAAGGDLRVSMTTAAFCPWTAASAASWIGVSSASGTGASDITLQVATNSGPARSGTVQIGGHTVVVSQDAATAPGCAFAIAPSSLSAGPDGQTVTIAVTAQANCAWSATSSSPWITVNGSSGGTGSGTITLTVAANSGPARSGLVTIAGQPFAVSQAAANTPAPQCTFAVSPSSVPIDAAGGSAVITVTTNEGCSWNVSGVPSWIAVSGTGGGGNGTVTLTVSANTGDARAATLTIAGQTVTVTQAAASVPAPQCTFAVSPSSVPIDAAGGSAVVTVTTNEGCVWNVSGLPSWIAASGTGGGGNGTVTLTVSANTADARTATLTIAGQTVTVTQAAGCSFTVSPTTLQVSNNASTQTIAVTTTSACAWTAAVTTGGTWLTITSGASGTGSGSVQVSVDRNRDPARTGTLTIAGKLVTINQDAK